MNESSPTPSINRKQVLEFPECGNVYDINGIQEMIKILLNIREKNKEEEFNHGFQLILDELKFYNYILFVTNEGYTQKN